MEIFLWQNSTPQEWGNRLLVGTNKTLCTQEPRRKEQWPHKGMSESDMCEYPGVSWEGVGWQWPAAGSGALNTTVLGAAGCSDISPFEGGHHYPYHISASGQTIGREHSPTHQNKTQIPPQPVGPPIRRLPQGSYPYPSEGRQNKNHNHRKLTKLITWTTTLPNSMKLWAMLCRTTQDEWVMVESSDKMWSIGEGNGKPFQYPCFETPMNSMKGKKIWHWKMNSPCR